MQASDLHIAEGAPVYLRIHGVLQPAPDAVLPGDFFARFENSLNQREKELLSSRGDLDLGISDRNERFRVHIFRQESGLALAVRHLPNDIPTCDQLGLPAVVQSWAINETGLVIVTGPTGSGKTTTLAAVTNAINQSRSAHVVTIEDPVEYHFPAGVARIIHREVGSHSSDFARAVRAGLREDVDVMIIGEMRDRETIEAALSVAETGHLVFATLHTHNAAQAVDRLVDAFPAEEQALTRSRLASCLLGVVYQRLLPAKSGGRVAAFEVLVANQAIRALIRDGKTHQIPNIMESARSEGMQPMVRGLEKLADAGKIDWETVNVHFRKNI